MRKVIKINSRWHPIVSQEYNDTYLLSGHYSWQSGRVALSVKVGKKRKLICGRIESIPQSCRIRGLYYDYYLTTKSKKIELLVKGA